MFKNAFQMRDSERSELYRQGYWIPANGEPFPVEEMSDVYLGNALSYKVRYAKEKALQAEFMIDKLQRLSPRIAVGLPQGDLAEDILSRDEGYQLLMEELKRRTGLVQQTDEVVMGGR